jgi:hypothetical protein
MGEKMMAARHPIQHPTCLLQLFDQQPALHHSLLAPARIKVTPELSLLKHRIHQADWRLFDRMLEKQRIYSFKE